MSRQPGLFDMDERLRRLSDIGDQLEAFGRVIDFEMFRPELDRERLTKAGAMKPGLLPASAEAAVPSLMCTPVLNGQLPAGNPGPARGDAETDESSMRSVFVGSDTTGR